MRKHWLLGILFLIFSASGPRAWAVERLVIERVSAIPKTIDVSKNEQAVIRFATNEDAFISITFKDENANLIYRAELGLKPAGDQTFAWNGKGEHGAPVMTDVVLYIIDARTEGQQYAHFDPSEESGGEDLEFPEFSLDKKTGAITYALPKAARVRLRAGLRQNALFRTIYDWAPQEAGRYVYDWNGLDESGHIKLLAHPDVSLNLNAFSLPDNAILVKGMERLYTPPDEAFEPAVTGKHFHYPHPRIFCHEPRFDVSFPDAGSDAGEISVTPDAHVPFKVLLSAADEAVLIRKRFEVIIYLDTEFLFEEEQAVSPGTYHLNTKGLLPGEHFLTVNVMSYDDHIGTKTVKLNVKP